MMHAISSENTSRKLLQTNASVSFFAPALIDFLRSWDTVKQCVGSFVAMLGK